MSCNQPESNRFGRLVALCKLWGAVKFFHPFLSYRDDIDWDGALVRALPKLKDAGDTEEYAAAVSSMLSVLQDPATRLLDVAGRRDSSLEDSSAREHGLTYSCTPDGFLIVRMHNYHDLFDFFGTMRKIEEIGKAVSTANGILFDLRAKEPLIHDRIFLPLRDITPLISTAPISTSGERLRVHQGFVPQRGDTSGGYFSAFRVVDGEMIPPAPEAIDLPVVFLINESSFLAPEVLALQMAGKGVIMAEGDTSDAAFITTHRILLGSGLTAEIRLGELVHADGTTGFKPDITVAHADSSVDGDPAFLAAMKQLREVTPRKQERRWLQPRAVPPPENAYEQMKIPSAEYRLLAAFRIWTIINYFFPYKDLLADDWDGTLAEFIPKMEQAENAPVYHLTVAEMIYHIHDTHGYVASPILREHQGIARPPVGLQIVEGIPVVTSFIDDAVAKKAGTRLGDVVLAVDGEDVQGRMAERATLRSASTLQSSQYMAANASLSGPDGAEIVLTVRGKDDLIREVRLPRKEEYATRETAERSGEVIRLLSPDIGYADLDRLEVPEVDGMFKTFKNTKAIIFDMRGYPKGTAWAIAPRLTEEHNVRAALFKCPIADAPEGSTPEVESRRVEYAFYQSIPQSEGPWYRGKTVMLIDERTLSQAEHTGLFFKAANNTTFIGSPTGGANGDVTNFVIPGGVTIGFTGQAVMHPDGRQLQRIGLVPEIEVRPTIRGIQDGRDEVLERAIEYLEGKTGV